VVFTPNSADGWADYEVEFEAKADAKCQFGMRVTVNPENRRYQGAGWIFEEKHSTEYHRYHFKVEGSSITFVVDGVTASSSTTSYRRGKPMLLFPSDKTMRIRSLRYKVHKVLKRR
jgi:hypothetical protein